MEILNTKRLSNNRIIAGALYDFLAYLTSLRTSISVGASEDCTIPLEKLIEWAQKRGLNITDADVLDWNTKI